MLKNFTVVYDKYDYIFHKHWLNKNLELCNVTFNISSEASQINSIQCLDFLPKFFFEFLPENVYKCFKKFFGKFAIFEYLFE